MGFSKYLKSSHSNPYLSVNPHQRNHRNASNYPKQPNYPEPSDYFSQPTYLHQSKSIKQSNDPPQSKYYPEEDSTLDAPQLPIAPSNKRMVEGRDVSGLREQIIGEPSRSP